MCTLLFLAAGFIDDINGWDFAGGCSLAGGTGCTTTTQCSMRATPHDVNGHGTHVAGVVAATLNNALGGAGAAPGACSVVRVRLLLLLSL